MNSRTNKLLFAAITFLLVQPLFAQQFGGNPPSLKWNQLNTDTVRVIYPRGLDSTANRVAAVVHTLQREHTSIGKTLRKVNIVLQNQTTLSNAYVSLAPYRSEFYLMPPQNSFELGNLNWADNLALHEYRHIQQYSNFNVGLSRIAGYILGQEGQALANGLSVPDWFFEGDAVFNETSLSTNGRGRLPDFFNGYKSLALQEKNYRFMKLRNGSYKHYVPGHYELGYLLVAYGRERFGAGFWLQVTHDAAAFKPLLYPLQGSVKRYAGVPYKQFVTDALAYYNQQWSPPQKASVNYITPAQARNVVNYRYPYVTGTGEIVALKSSYRQIPAFYLLSKTGERKIALREIAYDDYFSYNSGKIAYAVLKPDPRWGYKEFSNIKVLDLATGSTTRLTTRKRYFSPDIAHNGNFLVAAEMRADQSSAIVLLDASGKRLRNIAETKTGVYTYPKFSANDQWIYTASRNNRGEMALQKFSVNGGDAVDLIPFGNRVIGFPVVQGDTVYFSSSFKGNDETWAYVEQSQNVFRVLSNPTGIYQAVFDSRQNRMVASVFTADGYRLAAFPRGQWQPVNLSENALPDLYVAKALKQDNAQVLNNVPARTFVSSRYRKGKGALNFHSWRPYYDDPEFSFTLYSQNVLNTLRTELFYAYNRNEQSNKVGANGVFGAWYVQPLLGVNQTFQRRVRYNVDTTFYYNELNALAGLQLPLNLSGGRQYRYLQLSSTINRQQVSWTGLGKRLLNNQTFNFIDSRITYSGQLQRAVQQIYPHWAQTLQLRYRTIVNKYKAAQFLATGSVYLPALHPNHSIVLSAGYHTRDTANEYTFSNNFPFSRGYTAIDFPRMWRIGANYHFPLLYPDWGFANLVYFKRVRLNGFYDYTQTKSLRTGTKYFFGTAGGEMFFDTRWWNQQDVTFGVRYSRLLDKEYRGITRPNQWEFILPVNLIN
ncbi:hypothetical protein EXU57_02900 [Segetibacter sp. 3557_3]|uniref:TolB family protein n=1 Tax=Segetibacter sp. 3557_3 TaxID=2547429 RepID=UPI001058C1EF|nr:hypothetical protein [Segetibacter sp. 3557_3]TDH29038.1 hypothetical protein EXU57_02900 [Segetibacter sp. 3557_3]